jgi:WD40 repeat protein/serine/threonine protein kinase
MKQSLIAEPRHCAQCGVVLSVYSLEGVCGNCLLKPGLGPMTEPLDDREDESHFPALGAKSNRSSNTEEVGRFGDYELLEEIARGGMGIVYRARQVSLDRIVAVKMLLAGPLAGKDFVQRFRTEAAAAASLQHPNIVAIHEVGFAEGQHFFAMDFVEGLTLAQLVAKGPLPARQAATYLKTVAEAIHFAHERNVLHRDLKPSNVLVDSATDQPRVTDFGLAKRLEAETDLTLSGQLLGSPNYMSPEQAKAKRGTVGKRSDVYSLGAILYHLLTGRPPFQGKTLTEVLRQLADTDPLAPHLLIPRVPPDLETICVKCLEKEPAKRYQSAQELADELGRFLRHEPIHARPITRAERAWRWCRRKPALAGLILALHLVFALGLTGVLWQWRRATVSESLTTRNLYTADMNLAYQAWNEGSLQRAQKLLRAHLPQAGKEDLRGFEWRYLWRLCQDESRVTLTNVHFAGVHHGLALAADGQTLIAASGDSLKWVDRQKHREVQILAVGTNAIDGLSMSGDQPGLVAYHTDRIKALSPAGEELLGGGLAPGLGGGAFALSWDGSMLAASGSNTALSTVQIFAVKTGKPVGPAFSLGEKENIESLAFSPDSRYLACGTLGTKIHILEVPKLKPANVFTGHAASVAFLAFDRAGGKLVSRGGDSHIHVRSFPDGRLLADLPDRGGGFGDLAFSPDGLRLASGQTDHTVRLWNLARLELPPTFLHGHIGTVRSVMFSRDGNELYTGSVDGTVKVWDVSAKGSTNILHHPDWTDEVSFSPDGRLLAVADFNGRTAVLWDAASQRRVGNVGEHLGACRGVKFSPDGKLVATVGDYDDVQIWSISPIKRIRNLHKVDYRGSIAFHPSKPLLAVGCGDLRFRDLQTGTWTNLLAAAPTNDVHSVVFSPDGNRLALGMGNGEVSIWDFVTGRRIRWFYEHSDEINALCFSHHGTWLASGGKDNRVVLYEVRRGGFTRQLEGHTDWVFGLAFAPDDKTLVSTSWDGTIRFWSLANYQVALLLAPGGGGDNSVAFSPDGNLMATCGSDGTARLWPAAKFGEITASEKSETKKR